MGTGFLGSFSTFSSFSAELWSELVKRHWREAAVLAGGSVAGGLLAMLAGLSMGAQP